MKRSTGNTAAIEEFVRLKPGCEKPRKQRRGRMVRATLYLCRIELLKTFRNQYFIWPSLFWPLLFYFIYTDVVAVPNRYGGVRWAAFFLMSMASFSILAQSLSGLSLRFAQEKESGWARRLWITPLPRGGHLLSKIFAQMVLNAFILLFIFLAGAVVNGVRLPVEAWIGCFVWLWSGGLTFMALGLFIGTAANAQLSNALTNVLYLGLALAGGLWTPLPYLPKALQAIGVWLPSFRYGDGAWRLLSGEAPSAMDIGLLVVYFLIFVVLSIYSLARKKEG
ncbi:ABC transporter permease [Weizmannia acidilactici]|uniref:ABC transporter permease n=1 Tax=Weizmannia acidilactici TaxID=2607726 RepID=UPI00124F4AD6|nr:ABC transporter permease [Weizmannia acidilactici]